MKVIPFSIVWLVSSCMSIISSVQTWWSLNQHAYDMVTLSSCRKTCMHVYVRLVLHNSIFFSRSCDSTFHIKRERVFTKADPRAIWQYYNQMANWARHRVSDAPHRRTYMLYSQPHPHLAGTKSNSFFLLILEPNWTWHTKCWNSEHIMSLPGYSTRYW
jgi:hypothetical protein